MNELEEARAERRRQALALDDEIKQAMTSARSNSVAAFDQLKAMLEALELPFEGTCLADLPQGHRSQLVNDLAKMLRSAICSLERDFDLLPLPETCPFGQVLRVLAELDHLTLERRLTSRIVRLADALSPEQDWEVYQEACWRLEAEEIGAAWGWAPAEDVLERLIRDRVADLRASRAS